MEPLRLQGGEGPELRQAAGEDVASLTVHAGNGVHGVGGRQLSKLLPHDLCSFQEVGD